MPTRCDGSFPGDDDEGHPFEEWPELGKNEDSESTHDPDDE